MIKRKRVSKFEIEWQFVRVSVKGNSISLNDKLKIVREYFLKNQIYDRWERCYNWLTGLLYGYKDEDKKRIIEKERKKYEKDKFIKNEKEDKINFLNYSVDEKLLLWKDLYKRNEKWCRKGYFHKEMNDFLDDLYENLQSEKVIFGKYSFENLIQLRNKGKELKNNHKFLF